MKLDIKGNFRTLPNQIAGFRLAMLPVLWVLVLLGQPLAVGVLLAIAGVSDALDGYLARKLHQVTRVGSVLDTVADVALIASGLLWIPLLKSEILADHPVLSAAAIGLAVMSLLVEWFKFRRFANLHLYSIKFTSLAALVFFVHAFMVEGYSQALFFIVVIAWIVASLESLAIQLSRKEIDEHIGTILRRR